MGQIRPDIEFEDSSGLEQEQDTKANQDYGCCRHFGGWWFYRCRRSRTAEWCVRSRSAFGRAKSTAEAERIRRVVVPFESHERSARRR